MRWRIRRGPRVVITCPGCGRQIKKTRARLQRDHSVCCPACRLTFRPELPEVGDAQADVDRGS